MAMIHMVLGELEQEAVTTRNFLQRLPEDALGWRPHDKSMTAGQLALHIATIPGGVAEMADLDEASAPEFEDGFPQPSSKQEVLDAFEDSISKARRILATFDDARLLASWKVKMPNSSELVEMPRAACVRAILLNHWYHHRGQFGVYLRLLGASVPSAYGPSADEQPDWMEAAAH